MRTFEGGKIEYEGSFKLIALSDDEKYVVTESFVAKAPSHWDALRCESIEKNSKDPIMEVLGEILFWHHNVAIFRGDEEKLKQFAEKISAATKKFLRHPRTLEVPQPVGISEADSVVLVRFYELAAAWFEEGDSCGETSKPIDKTRNVVTYVARFFNFDEKAREFVKAELAKKGFEVPKGAIVLDVDDGAILLQENDQKYVMFIGRQSKIRLGIYSPFVRALKDITKIARAKTVKDAIKTLIIDRIVE